MIRKALTSLCTAPIRLYRLTISPLLGPSCRFHPTCSAYALEAITRHGPLKGLFLAACRLGKCHPYCHAHWHDPVPKRFTFKGFFARVIARQKTTTTNSKSA